MVSQHFHSFFEHGSKKEGVIYRLTPKILNYADFLIYQKLIWSYKVQPEILKTINQCAR